MQIEEIEFEIQGVGRVLVYLNGDYLPAAEAKVSIEDRGFLFADGVYEVIRVIDGEPHLFTEHLERMERGLCALRIDFEGADQLEGIAKRLVDENELGSTDATIYIQVTRGAAPRRHSFPEPGTRPTVLVSAREYTPHPEEYYDEGVGTITVPDTRWARCDIKSIALLPNVLANQRARESGRYEALLVRDGVLLEGSLSNLFAVRDGRLITYPRSNYILAGITRGLVIELARGAGIRVEESPIYLEGLEEVDELFLTGTTTEVMPVTTVDHLTIGDGRPGPLTRRLLALYRAAL